MRKMLHVHWFSRCCVQMKGWARGGLYSRRRRWDRQSCFAKQNDTFRRAVVSGWNGGLCGGSRKERNSAMGGGTVVQGQVGWRVVMRRIYGRRGASGVFGLCFGEVLLPWVEVRPAPASSSCTILTPQPRKVTLNSRHRPASGWLKILSRRRGWDCQSCLDK